MFGFFRFSNFKNFKKVNRQVYLYAVLIIFFGFTSGAFYSNSISSENFLSYSEVLKNYISDTEKIRLVKISDSQEIRNLLLIFFWSFFLFGKPFSGFFAFKSGFSIGFFISFFVKAYHFRGFLTGMAILFNYLIFSALPLTILTAWSFIVNSCITDSFFVSQKAESKKIILPYITVFVFSVFITLIGNRINMEIIPKIINSLF